MLLTFIIKLKFIISTVIHSITLTYTFKLIRNELIKDYNQFILKVERFLLFGDTAYLVY